MIIIPDIHGRGFWKEAVKKAEPDEKIIFLGDYLDPYAYEGITPEMSIENFKEILEFKKNNADNVILLLGNHDFHYINDDLNGGRKIREHADWVESTLKENNDLFDFSYILKIGDTNYIFSHAGFIEGWVNEVYKTDSILEAAEKSNSDFKNNDMREFSRCLNYISYSRGGYRMFGSPIWADMREHTLNLHFESTYQIFGHTQCSEEYIGKNYAMLDRRDAFRLNESDGKIERITFEDKLYR